MRLPVVALIVLVPLGGCLGGGEAACFAVDFPAAGASVTYRATSAYFDGERTVSYAVQGISEVVRGDGVAVPALNVSTGAQDGGLYVAVATRDLVYAKGDPVSVLGLNVGDGVLGNHAWGRCLAAGDAWTRPFHNPLHNMTFDVVAADGAGATLHNVRPVVASPDAVFETREARYRLFWDDPGTFPDRVVVDERVEGGWSAVAWWEATEETRAAAAAPEEAPLPYAVRRDSWVRYPPLQMHDDGRFPYESFLARLEARSDVQDFLAAHPDAYAVRVSWQEIAEQRSTTTRWSALLRDAGGEALEVEEIRRCYDDDMLRTLYGDCTDAKRYSGEPLVGNASAVEAVEPGVLQREASTVPVADVLRAAEGVAGDRHIVKLVFTAYPQQLPEGLFVLTTGPAGWQVYTGDIQGSADYMHPLGPRGVSFAENTTKLTVDDAGWVRLAFAPRQ